jgi:hypothetical protein
MCSSDGNLPLDKVTSQFNTIHNLATSFPGIIFDIVFQIFSLLKFCINFCHHLCLLHAPHISYGLSLSQLEL